MKTKVRFKPLFYHLMKLSLIQCLLAVIFTGVSLANEVNAQEILKQKVSVHVENQGDKTSANGH